MALCHSAHTVEVWRFAMTTQHHNTPDTRKPREPEHGCCHGETNKAAQPGSASLTKPERRQGQNQGGGCGCGRGEHKN